MKKIFQLSALSLLLASCAGAPPTAKETTKDFLQAIQDGNCGNAKEMCVSDAIGQVQSIQDAGCKGVKYDLTTITCTEEGNIATCKCEQRESEETDKVYLKKKDDKWVIEDFDGGFSALGAEEIVKQFAQALADGDCTKAREFATGNAAESVQGSIDAGCEKYDTEIESVTCEVSGEKASCTCEESRTGMDMTFNYDLNMDDGRWKVSNYQKDLGDDFNP